MKIAFTGWRRSVHYHEVDVIPVVEKGMSYHPVHGRKSIAWGEGMTAYAKVADLSLSGAFLMRLEFSPAELKSLLTAYMVENPGDALAIMAQAQLDAIRKLTKKKIE